MENSVGRAIYKRGKLYFNDVSWTMVKAVARRTKKSPKIVVIAALKRHARLIGKKRFI